MNLKLIHRLGSPKWCYHFIQLLMPYIIVSTILLFAIGLPWALWIAPPDYQQGDSYRIIYIHVPAAMLSMGVYLLMAISSFVALVWKMKIGQMVSIACAPIGACFTLLALITGMLWGKPMWGTWWIWDARLTSELILLFLYLGYIALYNSIEDTNLAGRACGFIAVIGSLNLPIIHYSVTWWQTLHQGPTISRFAKPAMDNSMLLPLFCMLAAFGFLFATLFFLRMKSEILSSERYTSWVTAFLEEESPPERKSIEVQHA